MKLPLRLMICAGLLGCLLGCGYLPHKSAVAAAAPVRILHLDPTVVNLADGDTAYLKLGVSLALESPAPKDAAADGAVVSVARDTVVTLASAQTSEALLSPGGKTNLKQAIVNALRRRVPAAEVSDVYFDDFLVQR